MDVDLNIVKLKKERGKTHILHAPQPNINSIPLLRILFAKPLVSTEVVSLPLAMVHPPAPVGEVVEPRPLVGAQRFWTQNLDLMMYTYLVNDLGEKAIY